MAPTVFTWHYVQGQFDFPTNPLAPMGCAVQCTNIHLGARHWQSTLMVPIQIPRALLQLQSVHQENSSNMHF